MKSPCLLFVLLFVGWFVNSSWAKPDPKSCEADVLEAIGARMYEQIDLDSANCWLSSCKAATDSLAATYQLGNAFYAWWKTTNQREAAERALHFYHIGVALELNCDSVRVACTSG